MRRFRLGEEPGENLSATTSPDERLAMMWRLTLDAWSAMGLAVPDYRRADAPVRFVRLASADER